MKKIFIFLSLVLLVASQASAAALAAKAITPLNTSVFGGVIGAAATAPTALVKFSTGVQGLVNFSGNTDYMLMVKHQTGSKIFGTAYNSTSIYWTQAGQGALTATKAIATDVNNFTAANAWTSY